MKDYIGDSVYAETDEAGGMLLTTNNGHYDDPRNRIYLEPENWEALKRFVARAAEVKATHLKP